MGDIRCRMCGEPWDSYGVRNGDMTEAEAEKFLAGEGCPSCDFGKSCPQCSGTGKKSDSYDRENCCRNGRILVWSPNRSNYTYSNSKWYYGYAPNVKTAPDDIRIIRSIPGFMTRDGHVRQAWAECPTCHGKGAHLSTCSRCTGTGKLGKPSPAQENAFYGSALEETDDPDSLLNKWTLGTVLGLGVAVALLWKSSTGGSQ